MLNLLSKNNKQLMDFVNGLAGFQTGCDLWEYLLLAQPDEEVSEKVWNEKKFFRRHYYNLQSITAPHITIASFLSKEPMEETLVRWIQNICNLHTSFEVKLNNFSGFPPHIIYARVQDPQPFKKLAAALKIIEGFIQSNECPPLCLVARPHLPLQKHCLNIFIMRP